MPKTKSSKGKPRSKAATARANVAALKLVDLVIAIWEEDGAPVGDMRVQQIARFLVEHWTTQGGLRGAAAIRQLLEPQDRRDPDGAKEVYRELTSLAYRGAAKERPGHSVGKTTWTKGRIDIIDPKNWGGDEIKSALAHFNEMHAETRNSARDVIIPARHGTTREGRKLRGAMSKWSAENTELIRTSLAGSEDAGGIWEWERLKPYLEEWATFLPKWIDAELKLVVKRRKAELLDARPVRGKTIRVDGEVRFKKRRGRPRKPMPRGPYKPRTPRPKVPAFTLQ